MEKKGLGFFEKYLSIWVALCIIAGIALGKFMPSVSQALSKFTVANVNIPIAVLIWAMIYPMMVKVDFSAIKNVHKGQMLKGLIVTWVTNWLIKPFSMFLISSFFIGILFSAKLGLIDVSLAKEYIAGAILLGAAPCTAMVFVWSYLADGDPLYTLVQVATNDIIILFAFAPIVGFLMGLNKIPVPYETLLISVVLFVVIPLTAGYISRRHILRTKGPEWFEKNFLPKLSTVSIVGLLLTLILIFSFQGNIILENPLHIVLIAIPLTIQTYFIFAIAYGWAWLWKLPHKVAAPASFIGASNFFELAVAVAIALFGLESGAALATVVGVLEEVPIMLSLVWIANRTRHLFTAKFEAGSAVPTLSEE
ncbi:MULTISPECIES: ACR3 family arsenite efflux transporter [Thermococcus]|uniref:Arsenical-resistance membrane protein n=1 Tax=Thermococcus sibiricus (strain DSM 12597 / MM 739) TaxID=604354 RepID=C6A556_THESM|nr:MULTISPECIES: ACR3 family arsenite efflux transporter [Thermococcus]ACS90751.1 Arsenical-resistance membrane protein [Thermococcus sibiricus MM 739]MBC7094226.1 ACR3 family arsenite efflux transporter [Thermococcus sp.]